MNVNFNRSWIVINSIIFIVFVKLVFSYVMIKIIIISWILNETMIGALMMNFKRRYILKRAERRLLSRFVL